MKLKKLMGLVLAVGLLLGGQVTMAQNASLKYVHIDGKYMTLKDAANNKGIIIRSLIPSNSSTKYKFFKVTNKGKTKKILQLGASRNKISLPPQSTTLLKCPWRKKILHLCSVYSVQPPQSL